MEKKPDADPKKKKQARKEKKKTDLHRKGKNWRRAGPKSKLASVRPAAREGIRRDEEILYPNTMKLSLIKNRRRASTTVPRGVSTKGKKLCRKVVRTVLLLEQPELDQLRLHRDRLKRGRRRMRLARDAKKGRKRGHVRRPERYSREGLLKKSKVFRGADNPRVENANFPKETKSPPRTGVKGEQLDLQ